MAKDFWKQNPGLVREERTRSVAYSYEGMICPISASFGYVHGESPNKGSMNYEKEFLVSTGKPIFLRCGNSSYFGLTIKGNLESSQQKGFTKTINFVDMRDRLHDVLHYAQYNMVDNDKFRIYHILPELWEPQIRSYCNLQEIDIVVKREVQALKGDANVQLVLDEQEPQEFETVVQFELNQEVGDYWLVEKKNDTTKANGTFQSPKMTPNHGFTVTDIITQEVATPPLSAKTILNILGQMYDFKIIATPYAMNRLETSYPQNLDWNTGTKVISCVEQVLSPLNLQVCYYGNLTAAIDMKGIAETPFDEQLLSGMIELCNMPGYSKSSLGSELNERGRRVNVVGGRNKYEDWYPCFPKWNLNWTFPLCDVSYQRSVLFNDSQVTMDSRLGDMPEDYRDPQIYDGVQANSMSLRQYLFEVCFHVYAVDFRSPLELDINTFPLASANSENAFIRVSTGNPYSWMDANVRINGFYAQFPSPYPVSSSLVSQPKIQFEAIGNKFVHDKKGEKDTLKQKMDYVHQDASLTFSDMLNESQATYIGQSFFCDIVFNQKMKIAQRTPPYTELSSGRDVFLPDHPFVRIALEKEVYTFDMGDSYSSPRVRTIQKQNNSLYKSFIGDVEDGFDVIDIRTNRIPTEAEKPKADQIARAIAENALLHEFTSNSGYIAMRHSVGYIPSGMIDSVNIALSQEGLEETINFTNSINNDFTPLFFPRGTAKEKWNEMKYGADLTGGKGLSRDDPKIEDTINLLKRHQAGQTNKPALTPQASNEANFGHVEQAISFGGEKNSVKVSVQTAEFPDDDQLMDGEVLVI